MSSVINKLFNIGVGPFAGEEHPDVADSNTPIGIEIELEEYINFLWLSDKPNRYWVKYKDGSLRPRDTGVEFITQGQMMPGIVGKEIIDALEYFGELIEYNKKSQHLLPTVSDRCSVHVHLNAGDMTINQLYNFIVVYLIFERVLFNYCGEDRYYNNYCIPLALNKVLLSSIYIETPGKAELSMLLRRAAKYSAFNLLCLKDKGTVEFRHHPGCYDWKRILEWVNILISLKKYALKSNKSWLQILSSVSGKGPDVFLEEVFGQYTQALQYNGVYDDIMEGVRDAQMIEYGSKLTAVDNKYRGMI